MTFLPLHQPRLHNALSTVFRSSDIIWFCPFTWQTAVLILLTRNHQCMRSNLCVQIWSQNDAAENLVLGATRKPNASQPLGCICKVFEAKAGNDAEGILVIVAIVPCMKHWRRDYEIHYCKCCMYNLFKLNTVDDQQFQISQVTYDGVVKIFRLIILSPSVLYDTVQMWK